MFGQTQMSSTAKDPPPNVEVTSIGVWLHYCVDVQVLMQAAHESQSRDDLMRVRLSIPVRNLYSVRIVYWNSVA